jgi:hypothetical protein
MRNDLLALAVVKVIQSVVTAPCLTEQGSAQFGAVPFTICELVTPAFSEVFPLVLCVSPSVPRKCLRIGHDVFLSQFLRFVFHHSMLSNLGC